MKKSILSTMAILLCLSTASYAQNIKKGTIEIDGGLGFDISSSEADIDGVTDDMEEDSKKISASALYYIRPNIGIGGIWKYDISETDYGQSKKEDISYGIGPIISYNVSMDDQISVKLQGGMLKFGMEDKENDTETEGFLWMARGMISYFIVKNVSINGSLAYTFGELEMEQGSSDTDMDTSRFDSSISISFYWK